MPTPRVAKWTYQRTTTGLSSKDMLDYLSHGRKEWINTGEKEFGRKKVMESRKTVFNRVFYRGSPFEWELIDRAKIGDYHFCQIQDSCASQAG